MASANILKAEDPQIGAVGAVGVDASVLRRVCAAYPTGVAIVSTLNGEGAPCGLTINSFASVSLDPPLVLWGLNANSPSLPYFDNADAFTISILSHEQGELASRFARREPDKFDGVAFEACERGVPIIEGAVASLECRPWSRVEAGDHILYIWRVADARVHSLNSPLVFHNSGFKRISA